ncbi:MAG: PEP-CTERM sorting domain-containing protein [Pirellulaceae bacterium]
MVGALFQDVSGINAGEHLGFEFAHRARVGTDVMTFTITDLGADNLLGGGNDSILFSKEYSATTLGWEFNTSASEGPIVAMGNNIRFSYEAVSTGSGNLVRGNFIDAVSIGTVAVPEPSTATLLGLAAFGLVFRRRRRCDVANGKCVSR